MLIKRREVALGDVTGQDVLRIDFEGVRLAGEGRVHLEAVLHAEVYRQRPDVGAVIHTHPPYATALGATDGRLELLTHDAVLFREGLALFKDSAGLIMGAEQGKAVARALGEKRAVLLRNHGVLVVGKDVPWAVLGALTLERALRLQSLASALGPIRPMGPQMAQELFPTKYHDDLIEEYWRYWVREARRQDFGMGLPEAD